MSRPTLFLALAFLTLTAGCESNPTPDQIRHDTAVATYTVVKDTKAVAKDIKTDVATGVHRATSPMRGPQGHPVDINRSNKLKLMTLPGVNGAVATRIIANRPYALPDDLLNRNIVTPLEFDKIAPRIITVN